MPDFYDGQQDYIQKLNEMADAFHAGPYDAVPKTGGTMSGPLHLDVPLDVASGGTGANTLAGLNKALHPLTAIGYDGVNDILEAISGPVSIKLPGYGRFAAPTQDRMRAGLAIFGEVVPVVSADGDRLECGSILEGTFLARQLDNVSLQNLGVDRGEYVCASKFSGVKDNAIVFTSWSGVIGETSPSLQGCSIANVVGLIPTTTPGAPVPYHGVLIEGMGKTCRIGDIDGYGGIASVVVKCKDLTTGVLRGFNGNPYTVVAKSNTYANCSNLIIPAIFSRDGGGVAFVSDDNVVGAQLSRVSVGVVDAENCAYGVRTDSATSRPVSDVHIDLIRGRGIVGAGLAIKGPNTIRVSVGRHYFEGCALGVAVLDGALDTDIGDGFAVGSTGYGYQIDAPGTKAGNIKAVSTSGGEGIVVNTADFTAVTATGGSNANGNFGGTYRPLTVSTSEPWSVAALTGFTVNSAVLMVISSKTRVDVSRGVLSKATINNGEAILVVPMQLRPLADKLTSITAVVGGVFSIQPVSVSSADGTITYRGATATQLYFTSLSYDKG